MKMLFGIATLVVVLEAGAETAVERDISYRPDATDAYMKERCKLDVRYPKGETAFKTVVWFHGGGLDHGNKHFIRMDESIAQVAANYRLLKKGNGLQGRDCIEDAAAAVAWTLNNIVRYGGDPSQVYVAGLSAGGYLTMMVGMAPEYLAAHGFRNTDLAGLAPVSGQATKHFHVRKIAGDDDPQFQPKIDDLAPLRWVSKDLPPIVSICGESPWEWKCRSEENRLLIASCAALGHPAAYFVQLPFADHTRAGQAGDIYVELFVKGALPGNLRMAPAVPERIADFRDLPPELAGVPTEELVQLDYRGACKRAVVRCDPKSERARACFALKGPFDPSTPVPCEVYDLTAGKSLAKGSIPFAPEAADGKYRWYRLFTARLSPHAGFYASRSWYPNWDLGWYADRDNEAGLVAEYEFWVSARFQGPAYVAGSGDENAVVFDRVLLRRKAAGK